MPIICAKWTSVIPAGIEIIIQFQLAQLLLN